MTNDASEPLFQKQCHVRCKITGISGEVMCCKVTRGENQYTFITPDGKICIAWERDLEKV